MHSVVFHRGSPVSTRSGVGSKRPRLGCALGQRDGCTSIVALLTGRVVSAGAGLSQARRRQNPFRTPQEIERLAGRLAFLKARTEMASIQVALVRTPFVRPPDGTLVRLWEEVRAALQEAWYGAFRMVALVIVLAAQLSPLAMLTFVGWALYRRWSRRRPAAAPPVVPQAG